MYVSSLTVHDIPRPCSCLLLLVSPVTALVPPVILRFSVLMNAGVCMQRPMYFDDKYKKLEEAERSEWRRKIAWKMVLGLFVLAILAGIAYFLHLQYEKLKLKLMETPVVPSFLPSCSTTMRYRALM